VIPAADIDRLLLSFSNADWQKVAKIIGNTLRALEQRGFRMDGGVAPHLDVRMAALVGSGQLEAIGDIKRLRYSEVRLPGRSGEAAGVA
jgi:hypothetical protein